MGIEPGTFSRYHVEMRYEIYLDGGVNHYAKRTTSRVAIPFMAKFIEYRILELNNVYFWRYKLKNLYGLGRHQAVIAGYASV